MAANLMQKSAKRRVGGSCEKAGAEGRAAIFTRQWWLWTQMGDFT